MASPTSLYIPTAQGVNSWVSLREENGTKRCHSYREQHLRPPEWGKSSQPSKHKEDVYCCGVVSEESAVRRDRTVVLNVFADLGERYQRRLQYFLAFGVWEDPYVDFVFIVNLDDTGFAKRLANGAAGYWPYPEVQRNALLPNVKWVFRENSCFDLGAIGAITGDQVINPSKYTRFFIMNGSVRGPFLPVWMPSHIKWTDIIGSMITDDLKLVGTTVSCCHAPHIQSYFAATDRTGFNLLLTHNMFRCASSKEDAIMHGEIRLSDVFLSHGYNIGSMMTKYRGVDFRLEKNRACMQHQDPTHENTVDGVSIHPYEMIFMKDNRDISERLVDLYTTYNFAWNNGRDGVDPKMNSSIVTKYMGPLQNLCLG